MKSNLIPTLSNGLTVAFETLHWGVNCATLETRLHGFVVILGGTVRIGAGELYELHPAMHREVDAIAYDLAHEEAKEERRERAELRSWRNAQ